MLVTLSGMLKLVRLVQLGKRLKSDVGDTVAKGDAGQAGALGKRLISDVGDVGANGDATCWCTKVEPTYPILMTLSGMVTLVRLTQKANAPSSRLVTVLGTV